MSSTYYNLETYEDLVKALGQEVALKVCQILDGEKPPKPSTITRSERNQRIKEAFNGKNLKEVARRFGLSPRHVRRVLKGL